MLDVHIDKGYIPGVIGWIVGTHARYYSENWDFGLFFETKVARDLSEFLLRYDDQHDGLWLALGNGHILGSIAIDGLEAKNKGAHLRWFIVNEHYHNQGIGSKLLNYALEFCKDYGFKKVYLWTFEGLNPARHLYEKAEFVLSEQREGQKWGKSRNEQFFELNIL